MDKTLRGNKHVCSNCSTKFFDFKKEKIICPKCGTELKIIKQNVIVPKKFNIKEKENNPENNLDVEEDENFNDDIEEVINDEIDVEENDIIRN